MKPLVEGRPLWAAACALILAGTGACARGEAGDMGKEASVTADTAVAVDPAVADGAGMLDETVWIGLVPVTGSQLSRAVRGLRTEERKVAAEELRQAGALLRLEASHAQGMHVRQRLMGAAIEVTELGNTVAAGQSSLAQTQEVAARALLALSEHHQDQAGRSLRAKRTVLAGRSLAQASREMQDAYEFSGLSVGADTDKAPDEARAAGERLEEDGSEAAVQVAESALTALRRDAIRLENALGARRR